MFKIKIKENEQVIARAKAERLEDLEPVFKLLKIKYRGIK